MTDERDVQSETGARSGRDPEVSAEVIQDLDAPDADDIKGGGGCVFEFHTGACTAHTK